MTMISSIFIYANHSNQARFLMNAQGAPTILPATTPKRLIMRELIDQMYDIAGKQEGLGSISCDLEVWAKILATLQSMPQWVKCSDGLREIVEIYAGMEGFAPETAPEAYLQRIIKQMND